MTKIDIEAIAREADLIEPSDVWADLPADYTQALSCFAAMVLEKAAQGATSSIKGFGLNSVWAKGYVEGVNDCAQGLRAMAAALQSGDRG